MTFPLTLRSLSLAAIVLLAPVAVAHAQQTGCPGKDLLGELKVTDAAAFTRLRAAADANVNGKAILWKIESSEFPDNPPSYLFGTIHVTDERVQTLGPAVEEALSRARRIGLEVEDMSAERLQEALTVMRSAMLPRDASSGKLETVLAQPEAARTGLMLARSGLPKEWLSRVKPWVGLLVTTTSDCERQRLRVGKLTLDAELARQAENRGVGSFGLESTEMQLSALADLTDGQQLSLLKSNLAAFDRIDDQTETQVQLYLAHDVGALWPLQLELGKRTGADAGALEAYRQNMIEDRNIRMRDRTLMHLSTGGIFMAVGAVHLPGEKGLVALLKGAGYTLTAVE